jgi:hypothetical protein
MAKISASKGSSLEMLGWACLACRASPNHSYAIAGANSLPSIWPLKTVRRLGDGTIPPQSQLPHGSEDQFHKPNPSNPPDQESPEGLNQIKRYMGIPIPIQCSQKLL